jgi:hypothetical protein
MHARPSKYLNPKEIKQQEEWWGIREKDFETGDTEIEWIKRAYSA